MKIRPSFPLIVLLVLSLEKFIQHMVVSYALYVDLLGIRETIAVDYQALLVSGFLVGILFLANVPLLLQRKRSGFGLLLFLALHDLVRVFIAQGTLLIQITVSFLVALVIVLILVLNRRRLLVTDSPAHA